jgi:hypothetical protein
MLNLLFKSVSKNLCFFTVLTPKEIESIDTAGSQGAKQFTAQVFLRRFALVMFAGAVGLGVCSYFGFNVL